MKKLLAIGLAAALTAFAGWHIADRLCGVRGVARDQQRGDDDREFTAEPEAIHAFVLPVLELV